MVLITETVDLLRQIPRAVNLSLNGKGKEMYSLAPSGVVARPKEIAS